MPLKTMRRVWRYKKKREGRVSLLVLSSIVMRSALKRGVDRVHTPQVCNARLVFEGKDDEPNRGEVRLENLAAPAPACYEAVQSAQPVKGKWLMKPAKFEGRADGRGGTIGTIQVLVCTRDAGRHFRRWQQASRLVSRRLPRVSRDASFSPLARPLRDINSSTHDGSFEASKAPSSTAATFRLIQYRLACKKHDACCSAYD